MEKREKEKKSTILERVNLKISEYEGLKEKEIFYVEEDMPLIITYLLFDLEARERENKELRKIIREMKEM